jgi:hypothetical protein
MPDPIMIISACGGKSDKCFAIGEFGIVQNDSVGFGTGRPGEAFRRLEMSL